MNRFFIICKSGPFARRFWIGSILTWIGLFRFDPSCRWLVYDMLYVCLIQPPLMFSTLFGRYVPDHFYFWFGRFESSRARYQDRVPREICFLVVCLESFSINPNLCRTSSVVLEVTQPPQGANPKCMSSCTLCKGPLVTPQSSSPTNQTGNDTGDRIIC